MAQVVLAVIRAKQAETAPPPPPPPPAPPAPPMPSFRALSVATGGTHSCAVMTDQAVACWGRNSSGQLGTGSFTDSRVPARVVGITSATQVTAGANFSCALLDDRSVRCWGDNYYGTIGDSTTVNRNLPVSVAGLTNVRELRAGDNHVCAIKHDGTAWCWGSAASGALGNGTTSGNSPLPVQVSGVTAATRLTLSRDTACVGSSSGVTTCWGSNSSGQFGNGASASIAAATTLQVTYSSISAGHFHICGVAAGGVVKCAGAGASGRLGNGSTASRTTPYDVVGLPGPAVEAYAGAGIGCARLADARWFCWGFYGLVGTNPRDDQLTAVEVPLLGGAVELSSTIDNHLCARYADGRLACWGDNSYGKLGIAGTSGSTRTPTGVIYFS